MRVWGSGHGFSWHILSHGKSLQGCRRDLWVGSTWKVWMCNIRSWDQNQSQTPVSKSKSLKQSTKKPNYAFSSLALSLVPRALLLSWVFYVALGFTDTEHVRTKSWLGHRFMSSLGSFSKVSFSRCQGKKNAAILGPSHLRGYVFFLKKKGLYLSHTVEVSYTTASLQAAAGTH